VREGEESGESGDLFPWGPGFLRFGSRADSRGSVGSGLEMDLQFLSILRRIATIESVGSFTRIEGVRFSDDEIDRLLSGVRVTSFRSRDEEEVVGYADLMEMIFETASPFDTPRLLSELVTWASRALQAGEHHVILTIAVFVVRFLAIHPFQDGNGRLSRALTTLLLLRADYGYVPYSSLERVVEDSKEEYYRALRRAQSTLDQDESRLSDWIAFFVNALLRQKHVLERKIASENLMAPLAPLSEKLLAIVREYGRTTVREAAALTGANRNTSKDHLARLVNSGHLARRGRGRGTWYERV